MKLEFQAKFLQHLNKKKQQDEGFTLIELLVVIIIIGILAAIALPSLLSQVNKGKQAEAKQNVGALNRAQQAYYLESNAYGTDVQLVGIGINTQTVNYQYSIVATSQGNTDAQTVYNLAQRVNVKGSLKSYLGLNFTTLGGQGTSTEPLALGKVCETLVPDNVTGVTPADGQSTCDQVKASAFKDLGGK